MHRLCHLKQKFSEWRSSKKDDEENEIMIEKLIKETATSETSNTYDKWFYISDSHVSEVNVSKVLKTQAYILFYQRI